MKQLSDLDFVNAAKILNVLIDPRASDDGSAGTGQIWFNTSSNRLKGYDGSNTFTIPRLDGNDTITGLFTFNPSSGSVPFAVDSGANGVVTNLNADRVDGYHAAEAATASTLAARDASGNLTVATPSSDGHAATKAYVDSIAAGQDWKDSCVAATTANITLSGEQTIDGVSVSDGERVLVKDQTTGSENGIYVCSTGAWSRSTDADENAEVTSGLTTFVEEGTANAGAGFTLTTSGVIVVDTTALTFTRSSGGSVYAAGNGIVKSGTTFHFAQSSAYSIGQIPYADSSSTIGMLAAGTANYVLKGQGAGSAPIWGQVNVSSEIIGTLPTGNGGTGTSTSFTEGALVVAGSSGVYTQFASTLFWDGTQLCVGTNTGSNTLNVSGTAYVSGNVGIGETSPLAKLHIEDSTYDNNFRFHAEGSTGGLGSFDASGCMLRIIGGNETTGQDTGITFRNEFDNVEWGIWHDVTDGNFYISRESSEFVAIESSGNVGINDSNPSTRLSIQEDSSNTTANGVITLQNYDTTANNWIGINFVTTDTSADPDGVARIAAQTTARSASGVTGDLTFWTSDDANNPSERMRIDSAGNIGIGTTLPESLLHLKISDTGATPAATANLIIEDNSSNNYINLLSANTDSVGIFFGDGDDANIAGVHYDHATDDLVLRTGNSNGRFVIDSAGDITHTGMLTMQTSAHHIIGGFGANSTGGTLDWDDSTNARSGNGQTLLQGSSTNGPDGSASYFHPFSFEYQSKDGTGNLTQLAVGYNALKFGFRYRFSSTWTSWAMIWHDQNHGAGSGLDADLLDAQEGSYYLDLANSTGDTDDISEGLTNLFYTDARARAAISSTDSAEIAYDSGTGVLGLGTEAGRVKSGTLGAGATPTFTHNLGTREVAVQVFRTGTPYDEVRPEIERTTTNMVTVTFTGTTPTSGEFSIVCVAKNG